ncbi:MAG: hypothetical protein ABR541_02520 [Candidatus Dormibacteria bacterium]
MTPPADFRARVAAALGGALLAEARVGRPAGAEQLLDAAESMGAVGELAPDDLKARGLDDLAAAGPAGVPIRAIAAALLTPGDRPAVRRNATVLARIAPAADFGTVAVSLAAGVLALDLLHFDLTTALLRLHQTLLEDAPILVLRRLSPLPIEAGAPAGTDAGATLQLAISALAEAGDVEAVCAAVLRRQPAATAAVALAAALAGVRGGDSALAPELYLELAAGARVAATAAALADRAASHQRLDDRALLPVAGSDPA